MSNTTGNTKDLNSSRKEALQGLLDSLGHYTRDLDDSSTEQLQQRLFQKIDQILGDVADDGLTQGDRPNQTQPLNEDGLPIIDISEPAEETPQRNALPDPVSEQDLIPLSLLSPDERERQRQQRDHILDLLEEEERFQQLQEERDAEEERKEALRKRRESAKAELERLKAARELQKKMGQALVWHAKEVGTSTEKEEVKPPIAKKTVSFADTPTVEVHDRAATRQPDLGDIIPGRLRPQSRVPLVSTTQAQEHPMKLHVVERYPTGTSVSPSLHADSDDESISSAGDVSPRLGNDSSGEEEKRSSSSDNDEPLEEGFDYDVAQHHREIALEYYKKRHAVGAETAKAMASSPGDSDQDESLQSGGQRPLSRFRADRMAAAYDKSHGPLSMSIGQSVIPASRQKSLRNSVRLGKLENDQLTGGHSGESGSEDEVVREVVQMLQAGSIQNAGPDFSPSSVSPPLDSNVLESPSTETRTPSRGPSRFRLARGGAHTETIASHGNRRDIGGRSQPAVSHVVERQALRPASGQRFPINKPPLRPEQASPVIIDSPSFPITASSMTTGSPLHNPARLERPPLVKSSTKRSSSTERKR